MAILALLQTGGGSVEVDLAALLRGAEDVGRDAQRAVQVCLSITLQARQSKILVDLPVVLRVVHLALAVTGGGVGEPGTVPAGGASPEGIVVDGLDAGQVTLLVAVKADPDCIANVGEEMPNDGSVTNDTV